MTVYVDDMLREATLGRWPAKWSHLLADSPVELAEFAERLGLPASWLQAGGTHREHYDVTATVRSAALGLGAVPISYPRGTAEVLARKSPGLAVLTKAAAAVVDALDVMKAAAEGAS